MAKPQISIITDEKTKKNFIVNLIKCDLDQTNFMRAVVKKFNSNPKATLKFLGL